MVKVSIKIKCGKYLEMEGVASFIILFVRVNTGISRMAWFRGLVGEQVTVYFICWFRLPNSWFNNRPRFQLVECFTCSYSRSRDFDLSYSFSNTIRKFGVPALWLIDTYYLDNIWGQENKDTVTECKKCFENIARCERWAAASTCRNWVKLNLPHLISCAEIFELLKYTADHGVRNIQRSTNMQHIQQAMLWEAYKGPRLSQSACQHKQILILIWKEVILIELLLLFWNDEIILVRPILVILICIHCSSVAVRKHTTLLDFEIFVQQSW
jgi:hypothetical protein